MSKEYTRRLSILGSIPRHGPIVFFDDFEDLLKWVFTATGADFIAELYTNLALYGNQSLHLKTRTTGTADGDSVIADVFISMHDSQTLKLTAPFRITSLTDLEFIGIQFSLFDGTNENRAGIFYYGNTPDLRYWDATGNRVPITGSGQTLRADIWHTFHLLVDMSSGSYISAGVNQNIFSLAGVPFLESADATNSSLKVSLRIEAAGATPAEAYFDEFLITEF